MDEQEQRLMAQYGITAETRIVFHYGGYRYDRLADAVNYATKQAPATKGGTSQDTGDSVD